MALALVINPNLMLCATDLCVDRELRPPRILMSTHIEDVDFYLTNIFWALYS